MTTTRYVTAQIVFAGRNQICREQHVIYAVVTTDCYDSLWRGFVGQEQIVSFSDASTGKLFAFRTSDCSAIHCGSERDTP